MGKEVLGIGEEQFRDACLDAGGELLDELRRILAEQDNDEIMNEPVAEVGTLGSYARAADILWGWRNNPETGLQALAAAAEERGMKGFAPGLLSAVVREAATAVALGERYQSEQDVESLEHNMREGLLEAWDTEVRTPKGGVPHTAKLLSQARLESLEADVKSLADELTRAPYVFQPDYVLHEWDTWQLDHPASRGVELRQGETRELCRNAAENLGWVAALQDLCDEQLHAEFDTFMEGVLGDEEPARDVEHDQEPRRDAGEAI